MYRAADRQSRERSRQAARIRWTHPAVVLRILGVALTLGLSGCVLTPKGTAELHAQINAASRPFEPRLEARDVPDLPGVADWHDILSRAFLANGDLESSYFEWKAAFTRIDQAATWPNSNVALSYSYMFSPGNMRGIARRSVPRR